MSVGPIRIHLGISKTVLVSVYILFIFWHLCTVYHAIFIIFIKLLCAFWLLETVPGAKNFVLERIIKRLQFTYKNPQIFII